MPKEGELEYHDPTQLVYYVRGSAADQKPVISGRRHEAAVTVPLFDEQTFSMNVRMWASKIQDPGQDKWRDPEFAEKIESPVFPDQDGNPPLPLPFPPDLLSAIRENATNKPKGGDL